MCSSNSRKVPCFLLLLNVQLRDPLLQPLTLTGQEHQARLEVGGGSGATPKVQYLAQLQHHHLVQLIQLLLLLKLNGTSGGT